MSKNKPEIQEDNRIDNWSYLWMAIFMALGYLIFSVLHHFFGNFVTRCAGGVVIAVLVALYLYSALKKTINERRIIYIVLVISIVLRVCYVLTTAQTSYSGAEYEIFHNVHTNLALPESYQPLYYVGAGMIYNTVGLFRFTQPYAVEIIRLITEYFGIVSCIALYYILCELEANDTAVYLCTALLAFNPGLIILGGQIKPDMLMVALLTLTTLFLSRWNNFTDGYNFLLMSIAFGLAVMTDNAAFVYLPVILALIVINLVRTIQRRNAINILTTVIQTVSGLVAWFVLSFAYPLYNRSLGLSTGLTDLLNDLSHPEGSVNLNQRFLSFSLLELLDVYPSTTNDKNAWAYFIKTSLFGSAASGSIPLELSVLRIFVLIGFVVAASAALMVLCNIFTKMDAKKKVNIWTLVGLVVAIVTYYVLVSVARPTAESMDFSVIPILLVPAFSLLATGMKTMDTKKKLNFVAGLLYFVMVVVSFAYCVTTAAFDLTLLK